MGLSKIFALLIVTSLICVNSTEELRYLDDNFNYTQDIEKANPSEIKLTASLDIKLTGKCESSDPNVFTLIGCNNVHNAGDNNFKSGGKINNDIIMEQYRMINEKLGNLANAIRDTNLEVVKIKELSYDDEDGNEQKNVGFKTAVGVYYKPSSVKNGKLYGKNATNPIYPKSCNELFNNDNNVSGIYKIQPTISKKPFVVLCDMHTKGGGWAHVQKRFDGSQDFLLEWRDYKFGFGNLYGEFWIGNEQIYQMTAKDRTELLVELEDRDGIRAYAHYTSFKVGPEKEGYPLSVLSGYSGDAGDPFSRNLGMKFTTKDFDQDIAPENCAVHYTGAWWHDACFEASLNGKYINLNLPTTHAYQGLNWHGIRPHGYSYAKSRMLIRSS